MSACGGWRPDGVAGVDCGVVGDFRADADAFAITLGWHLGPQPQNISILQGYNQGVEDRMLRKARWREDGYRLFSISSLALSSAGGWFAPITESNCFALKRHHFQALGGLMSALWRLEGVWSILIFSARRLPPSSSAPGCCWGRQFPSDPWRCGHQCADGAASRPGLQPGVRADPR